MWHNNQPQYIKFTKKKIQGLVIITLATVHIIVGCWCINPVCFSPSPKLLMWFIFTSTEFGLVHFVRKKTQTQWKAKDKPWWHFVTHLTFTIQSLDQYLGIFWSFCVCVCTPLLLLKNYPKKIGAKLSKSKSDDYGNIINLITLSSPLKYFVRISPNPTKLSHMSLSSKQYKKSTKFPTKKIVA